MNLTKIGSDNWISEHHEESHAIFPTIHLPSNTSKSSPMKTSIKTPMKSPMKKVHTSNNSSSLGNTMNSLLYNEKPATRQDILNLENEYEQKIKYILYPEILFPNAEISSSLQQPYREVVLLLQKKCYEKYNLSHPIDSYHNIHMKEHISEFDIIIKCECLIKISEEICDRMIQMLSVNSSEWSILLRKIKQVFLQLFVELLSCYKDLYSRFQQFRDEARKKDDQLEVRESNLHEREKQLNMIINDEKHQLSLLYEQEKMELRQLLHSSDEHVVDLNESLSILHDAFRVMKLESEERGSSAFVNQNSLKLYESSVVGDPVASTILVSNNIEDMRMMCRKLQNEIDSMQDKVMQYDKCYDEYRRLNMQMDDRSKQLEVALDEINTLRLLCKKKEETIHTLNQQNLENSLEIENLKEQLRRAELRSGDNDLAPAISLKNHSSSSISRENSYKNEVATPSLSVLCIRCKKTLDDVSNIRSVIYDSNLAVVDPSNGTKTKMKCEIFRSLLPNFQGRQPTRSTTWIRTCIRMILLSKLSQDSKLLSRLNFQPCRIPLFTYSWFERIEKQDNAIEQSHEDRWGFYYGVRTLSRDNDPEGTLMWLMLDESFNDDGNQFVIYCLSVVLSLSKDIWKQLGERVLKHGNSINSLLDSESVDNNNDNEDINVNRNIWLNKTVAIAASQFILQKGLDIHINEVIETINALTLIPQDSIDKDLQHQMVTHVDLFLWLRLMMKQYQSERDQRETIIQVLSERSTVGYLSSKLESNEAIDPLFQQDKEHIPFPYFEALCKSIFPNIPTYEVSKLFDDCLQWNMATLSKRIVTSDVFLRIIGHQGFFTRYSNFISLGVLFDDNDESMNTLSSITNQQYQLKDVIKWRFVTILPEIQQSIRNLPLMYQSIIKQAIDDVKISLELEYPIQPLAINNSQINAKKHPFTFAFTSYRYLLSLVVYFQYLLDNPFISSSLLSIDKSKDGMIRFDLKRVELLLSNLETSVVDINISKNYIKKSFYESMKRIHEKYQINKIQRLFRRCCRTCVIPRNVRRLMRPGYTTSRSISNCNNTCTMRYYQSLRPIKTREIHWKPWRVMSTISSVLMFHISTSNLVSYNQLGQLHVHVHVNESNTCTSNTLAQSLFQYFKDQFIHLEFAEREIHDFFLGVHNYSMKLSRVHLFACMMNLSSTSENMNSDINRIWQSQGLQSQSQDISQVLQSSYAMTAMIVLLDIIHIHLNQRSYYNLTQKTIFELFPSSLKGMNSIDNKSYWNWNGSYDVLMKVMEEWVKQVVIQIKYINSKYILLNSNTLQIRLKLLHDKSIASGIGMIDVDDFIWLMMSEFAKEVTNISLKLTNEWKIQDTYTFITNESTSLLMKDFMIEKLLNTKQSPLPDRVALILPNSTSSTNKFIDIVLSSIHFSEPLMNLQVISTNMGFVEGSSVAYSLIILSTTIKKYLLMIQDIIQNFPSGNLLLEINELVKEIQVEIVNVDEETKIFSLVVEDQIEILSRTSKSLKVLAQKVDILLVSVINNYVSSI